MSERPKRTSALTGQRLELLASLLAEQGLGQAAPQGIPRRKNPQDFPLSSGQQRLWFLDRLERGIHYNDHFNLRLSGSLNVFVLEQALAEIVRRHEAMRAVFSEVDGVPTQIIAAARPLSLPRIDLRDIPESDRFAEATRLAVEEARAPFNLAQGPLWRFTLLFLAEDDHLLLITAHHVAIDGWSRGVFLRELSALYPAFLAGRPSPLKELAIQYADYAAWQAQWLENETVAKQLEYWKRRLAGAPGFVELPSDGPRPAVQTFRGARHWLTLSPAATASLKEFCQREGATLFMALLAVLQVLLRRYTGQKDILIGTPVANRTRNELEEMIGYFLNTLVLRGNLSGDPVFRDLLNQARATTLDALAHQDLPLEKLIDALQPERNQSYTPLFQVFFVLQNTPMPQREISSVAFRPFEIDNRTAKFDLTLSLAETSEGLTGWIEYATDLFDANRIERLAGHFQRIVEDVAANPDLRVSQLSMLSPAERQQLLGEWNRTARDFPRNACVHELFEEQARRTPDWIALEFQGEQWSYARLNARADRLADRLRSLGVGPEALVGLCLERSPQMVASLLGILKAGGAYVPLDPAYPKERLASVLEDAQAKAVVTERSLLEMVAGLVAALPTESLPRVVCADEILDSEPAVQRSIRSGARPENLAYVIFTSGSTGRPKGVQIEHRSVVNFLESMRQQPGLSAEDVLVAVTTLSFDIAGLELLLPLTTGARVLLANRETASDGHELARLLERSGATVMQATPATWRLLLTAGWKGHPKFKALCGGEAWNQELAEQLLERCGSLWNMYGPTETTIWSAANRVSHGRAVFIAGPIGNTRFYIVDEFLQPVPIGVPGELCIGGDGVARGYLNRAELTSEMFIADPFVGESGARLYRTGDLARYRGEGVIEFLGRMDQQVKLRGFRIELGEIESVLGQHPGVRQAVASVREDVSGDPRLVAYLIPASAEAPSAADLRDWLRSKLPEYMVPAVFVPLETLPLTPNGKVNRKALPEPDRSRSVHCNDFVAPRTALEQKLAVSWAEVLGVGRVGIDDNFFELGGHSLLGARLISRLRQELQLELPLRSLFEFPTIAGLAECIENIHSVSRKAGLATQASTQSIPRLGQGITPPLSSAQVRLWFLDQLESGIHYNVHFALRLSGRLEMDALERALGEIVRRHEAMRSVFPEVDGQPVQRVAPPSPFSLPVIVLRDLSAPAREAEAIRLAVEEARRPFNLAQGPTWRLTLLALNDDQHLLLVTAHHIAMDGWSWGVFLGELRVLYRAYANRESSPLAELPIQYGDYAAWHADWLKSESIARQLDYWTRQLAGAPGFLELPTDRPRPTVQTFRGAWYPFNLPQAATVALKNLCQREGVTLFSALLAMLQTLLNRYTGQEDILVGAPVANRPRAELEGLIGCFLNTVVLRGNLSGDPTFREVLQQGGETVLEALAHQDVPLEKLIDTLQPERNQSYSPLFQVLLVLQNTPMPELEMGGLILRPFEVDNGTAKFDLTLILTETPEGLAGWIEYATDLFDADRIARLAGHLGTIVEEVTANPDLRLSQLSVLTAGERQQLLVEWNRTAADYPKESRLDALFEEQARHNPGRTAVEFEGKQWTYAELDAQANRIAARLRSLGVGPDRLVGLCVERSPQMVASVLGILKAGGAYVPLDPAYPAERLALVLEDARVSAVLTQRSLVDLVRCLGPGSGEPGRIVCVEEISESELAQERGSGSTVGSNNLAYVIYTSGSTGKPKGVQIEHRSVVNFLASMRREPGLSEVDVLVAVTTLSFDIAGLELLLPLSCGARVVLASRETASDGQALVRLLERSGATMMQATPTTWRLLLEAGWSGHPKFKILCGGEAWNQELAEQLLPRCGSLWNMYGPTETTIWSAAGRVSGGEAVVIAGPIANTQFYIVDKFLQPVPIGVAGELCISGDGVARGYWNRPELTSEKFTADPFGGVGRMYRTGDLARYRADGAIEFLGRMDQQVKLRGFRIELGEIESVLGQHPGVRQAVASVREDVSGDPRLVAYLIPASAEAPSAAELRDWLRSKLPEYMVPAVFVTLETLPLTPNGKVNRKALPEPDRSRSVHCNDFVPPRTALEQKLAVCWAEVLGVGRVGIDDNFFELGGHSLLGARLISRLRQELQLELPLRSLFEFPTIAGLAECIENIHSVSRKAGLAAQASAQSIPRLGQGITPPLSSAQVRLWFLDQLEGGIHYNVHFGLRLSGRLEMDALERALGEIVRRHEAMRSVFPEVDGQPVQQVSPPSPFSLPVIVLRDLSAPVGEAEAIRLAVEEARRPFNLAQGPTWRLTLVALNDDQHLLLVTAHHIAMDGWSWGVFLSELRVLYRAYANRESSPLAELPIQYGDYAAWHADWLKSESVAGQLNYWTRQLAGAPGFLELPSDRPRPAVQTFQGAWHPFTLARAATIALKNLCQREGVTLFSALLATLQTLLNRYTGQEDILVGTPVANRPRAELEGLIGCFLNTVVLRGNLSGDPTFREVLRQGGETVLDALAHQDVPLEKLIDALQPERNQSYSPLFQVLLVLQNTPMPELEMGGLILRPFEVDNGTAKFDLTLILTETPEGLAGWIEYATDLFDADRIARLAGHLGTIVEEVTANPDLRLSQLSVLTAGERQQLLVEWNRTAADYPKESRLDALFEEQARHNPGRTAVEFEGKQWTYAELDAQANRIAARLRSLGVGPDRLVGLCVERSPQMVASVLGILKAGGAYVPLDPAYPAERLALVLEDARVSAVLTQRSLVDLVRCLGPGSGEPGRIVCVEEISESELAQERGSGSTVGSNNLAYVIYTSGSTGKPKGVQIEHRSVVNFLASMRREPGLSEVDVLVAVTTLSFDIAGLELLLPLSCGARVVLASRETASDGQALVRLLERSGATMMQATPTTWRLLLEAGWSGHPKFKILCGGEAWNQELAEQLLPRCGSLWNMYGPTETTIWSAAGRVSGGEAVVIAGPIANTQFYIVDKFLQPVPIGVAGELCISGDGVARGYWNRPELTSEKFTADPFGGVGRMYRTGDLARYRADGAIEFLGRMDQQVKLRGFRIELGEIESVLGQHPGVRQAVASVREDVSGDPRLVAYLIPASAEAPSTADLRDWLRSKLPEYMVPAVFVTLETLPLTPNGKVNRKALPEPDRSRSVHCNDFVPPRTALEQKLAVSWAEVLGVGRVGIDDNFFELGGHSLLGARLISRLRQELQLELPLRSLFEFPTIAGLAECIENIRWLSRKVTESAAAGDREEGEI